MCNYYLIQKRAHIYVVGNLFSSPNFILCMFSQVHEHRFTLKKKSYAVFSFINSPSSLVIQSFPFCCWTPGLLVTFSY